MIANKMKYFWLGAALSFILSLPFFPIWTSKPYSDVEILDVELIEGDLYVETQFRKLGCDFYELAVVGIRLGFVDVLEWDNTDGVKGDRISGKQNLNLVITDAGFYDEVEVRVRHICDGEKVDTVYAKIEVPSDE